MALSSSYKENNFTALELCSFKQNRITPSAMHVGSLNNTTQPISNRRMFPTDFRPALNVILNGF